MIKSALKRLILAAMFLAIGIVLPSVTMQIRQIGNMLLPMHLPVMLCGAICGWKYGGAIGLILPVFRSLLFSKPTFYPNAVAMAVELCVYGVVIGLVYLYTKNIKGGIFIALVSSILIGRIIWGLVSALLYYLNGTVFTFGLFLTRAFAEAFPGIIAQLILVPAIVLSLKKAKLIE